MSMMMGISSPNTRRLEFRDKGGKVVQRASGTD